MITRDQLLQMHRRELREILRGGFSFQADELADHEYEGISLGLPAFVERLTWKKFRKVFHRDGGSLRGWNVRMQQNALEQPWLPMLGRDGQPRCFGHFRVVDAPQQRWLQRRVERAVLLDYGAGKNHVLDPIARLRDPLVAVNPNSVELLLGWSYLELGALRLGTPSFFTLERGSRFAP